MGIVKRQDNPVAWPIIIYRPAGGKQVKGCKPQIKNPKRGDQMKYNKRIIKRTLVDADIEINQILMEQRKLYDWLKEKHPDVKKEYNDFRLAEIMGFETKP